MKQLCWITLAAVGLTAHSANAQTGAVFGKDDSAFARALSAAGYDDLYKQFVEVFPKYAKGGADETQGIALGIESDLNKLIDETDPLKRRDALLSVLDRVLRLIDNNPRSPVAQQERALLPDVYRMIGECYGVLIAKEADAAKKQQLKDKAQEIFNEAETASTKRVEEFAALRKDPNAKEDQTSYYEEQYKIARYGLAKIYYFNSKFYAPDDASRTVMLKKAIDAFEEFDLDYGNEPEKYESSVFVGFCNRDLGKNDDALAAYDDAISLRETWGPADANSGVFPIPPDAQAWVSNLVANAVLQKVKLLGELKDSARAKECVDDFYASVPRAKDAQDAFGLLAALANVQKDNGDTNAAVETAKRLVDLDPSGPWGDVGRQIIGGAAGVAVPADQLLKIAGQMALSSKFDKALDYAARARLASRGTDQANTIGPQSLETEAYVYIKLKQLQEATVAYDAVYERFPKSDRAAEALYQSGQLYKRLADDEKKPFYTKRAEERQNLLASNYPTSPRAVDAIMSTGEKLENQHEWAKAAEFYLTFKKGSAGYESGLYRAAKCYFAGGLELWQQKKADDAKNLFKKADETAKLCQSECDAVLKSTLDTAVQTTLGSVTMNARFLRAQIVLHESVGRPQEVFPLLEDVEQRYGQDANRIATAWQFRIQSLVQQGKLDEACAKLDNLIAQKADSPAVPKAAGSLARALDTAGLAAFEKDPKSRDGESLWRRAGKYYWTSLTDELAKPDNTDRDDKLITDVAQRFFVFALQLNGVPPKTQTFVGREDKPAAQPEFFEKAIKCLEVLANSTSGDADDRAIVLARCHGFLGHWKEAADIFGGLFARSKIIEAGSTRFSSAVTAKKPQLIFAYLDWAVSIHLAGVEAKDNKAIAEARERFGHMLQNTTQESGLWWTAKIYQIRSLIDSGDYDKAELGLRDVERTSDEASWVKFGVKDAITRMRTQLQKLGHYTGSASTSAEKPEEKNK